MAGRVTLLLDAFGDADDSGEVESVRQELLEDKPPSLLPLTTNIVYYLRCWRVDQRNEVLIFD